MWHEGAEENLDGSASVCSTPRAAEFRNVGECSDCPPAPRKRKPHFSRTRANSHYSFLPVLDFDSLFS
ncbi:hypothetical protein KP509_15G039400 [Ceratopteris richardii]|nr:hypothetical protein KP509_15G039400 [Ceratopteris richardii]